MTRLAEVPAGAWDDLLESLGCSDAYLRSEYVAGATLLDEGETAFLHLDGPGGDVVFACIVRELPETDRRDVITPYGYGGPVGVGEDPPAERFYELYEAWCAENGIVSTFIRFHPLFANQRSAPSTVHLSYSGPTVGWRLDDGRDLLAGMHGNHRNTCRKAMRAGVRVQAAPAPNDLAAFAALYEETMRRLEAADYYFFSPAYWELLSTRLRDLCVRFDALLEGEVVASALCLAGTAWLHYHLGAMQGRARELGANNLLLYEAACWAREQGLSVFHLGGSAGTGEDSLFHFKRRFSPDDLYEYWVGKAVHDEEAYRGLSGRADIDLDGFFPAYRAPRARSAVTPNRM